jgi:hypothetical protein
MGATGIMWFEAIRCCFGRFWSCLPFAIAWPISASAGYFERATSVARERNPTAPGENADCASPPNAAERRTPNAERFPLRYAAGRGWMILAINPVHPV